MGEPTPRESGRRSSPPGGIRARHRRGLAFALLAFGLLLVGSACSGGATFNGLSTERQPLVMAEGATVGASGIPGGNSDDLDLDTFCRSNTNIDACFVLTNQTRAFTGPFMLGATIPLTVNRYCSGNGHFGELGGYAGSGCWGGIMYWDSSPGTSSVGRLTPNPFSGTAAMMFKSNGPWSGVTIELEIVPADPSIRSGSPAKAYFDTPFVGSNSGSGTDGTYLQSTLDGNSFGAKSYRSRPTYTITNRPVRIRLQNSAPNVYLKLDSTSSTSDRFVADPKGQSTNASLVPPKSNAFYGGYRAVSGRSTYTLTYRVTDSVGSMMPTPTCPGCGTKVTVSFDYDTGSANPAGSSTCTVTSISPNATYNCSGSSVAGGDDLLTFSINFREGST